MSEEKIVFCTGGGCTAKLGAGVLSRILENRRAASRTQTCWSAMTARTTRRSTASPMTLRWCRRWIFSAHGR